MKSKHLLFPLALFTVPILQADTLPVSPNDPANRGTNTIVLSPGLSLIANPLYHNRGTLLADAVPDNTVGELFKQVPNGTALLKFDNATQEFSSKNMFHHGDWSDPQELLEPGEGAFIFVPGHRSLVVRFTGNCAYGGAVAVPMGLSAISSPDCGTINFAPLILPSLPYSAWSGWDNLSFDPREGDVVYTLNDATQRFERHSFNNGVWDSLPVVGVGQACFVHTSQPRIIQYTAPPPS